MDENNIYTHCDQCKENCDNPCECLYIFAGRCKNFPIFGNSCEKCGHTKKVHEQENNHYIYEEIELSDNTSEEKNILNEQKERE